jgi:hypothetical protein
LSFSWKQAWLLVVATADFKLTIIKAFAEDGRFAEMRNPERHAAAREKLAARAAVAPGFIAAVLVPEGVEVQDEDRVFQLNELAQEIDSFLENDDESYSGEE